MLPDCGRVATTFLISLGYAGAGIGPEAMNPKAVLIDTDVLVDFLRGLDKAGAMISAYQDRIILSAISVAELYVGVKGDKELATIDAFVGLFRIVPVTAESARLGGIYKCDYHKSHAVGLTDAILAATA